MKHASVLTLRRYRAMGWLAGWLLVRCGKLALRHGDHHEFRHLRAAVEAGNTAACSEDCPLWTRERA